jgi:hypothetical protein
MVMTMNRTWQGLTLALALLGGVALASTGCMSKSSGPLPGDSVDGDGGVALSPPRFSTVPHEAREAREGLGPIESRLFPPELVMEHQLALAITAEQTQKLLQEIDRGQKEMLRLQWDLQREKESLVKTLDPDHVDDAKALAVAAKLMEQETRVKASHFAMLVRVKNLLTAEQIQKLREIRGAASSPLPRSPTASGSPASTSSGASGSSGAAPLLPSAPRAPRPRPVPPSPVNSNDVF